MSEDMLGHLEHTDVEAAADGAVIDV